MRTEILLLIYNLFSQQIMATDLITLKNELLNFHTKLRRNPRSAIPQFEDREAFYKDNLYFIKNKPKKAIRTKEGYGPIKQLIEQLKRTPSFDDLMYSKQLENAAQDHADYLSRQSQAVSQSTDLQQRVERYTDWEGHLFQNVEYGYVEPDDILNNLLIDDGLKNRPNRMNILNPETKFFGLGLAKHPEYNVVAVFIYATQLRKKMEQVAPRFSIGRITRLSNERENKEDKTQEVFEVKRQKNQIIQQGESQNRAWCGDKANGDSCLLF